jgi:hypothetical protein
MALQRSIFPPCPRTPSILQFCPLNPTLVKLARYFGFKGVDDLLGKVDASPYKAEIMRVRPPSAAAAANCDAANLCSPTLPPNPLPPCCTFLKRSLSH